MRIAIIGLGLIGGSFAKALRKYTAHSVSGWDKREDTLQSAQRDGGIETVSDALSLIENDIVIVALPPQATAEFILNNKNFFKKGAIVTDVCGIKSYVHNHVYAALKQSGVVYLGAHPMAGKEVSGYGNASADLFLGASLILTSVSEWQTEAVVLLKSLAMQIGFAAVTETSPEHHDRVIAYTSQLAHVVSNAYVKSKTMQDRAGYSAGSFQDLTRVALLDEELWADLMMENRVPLLAEVEQFINSLTEYRDALASGERASLRTLLKEGKDLKLADIEKDKKIK